MREAEQILAKVSDSIERVHSVQRGQKGTLRIGYIKCMEMGSFPRNVQNFYFKYPGVGIDLKRDNAVALHDEFLMGEYDIILMWKVHCSPIRIRQKSQKLENIRFLQSFHRNIH